MARRWLERIGSAADAGYGAKPLADCEAEIEQALAEFPQRIVVFIDDIDRLEPAEAVEIPRLVRAVADFPNVVDVLCYDRWILAEAVCKAINLDEEEAYLEKMVEIVVPLPSPEAFALRHMFMAGLQGIVGPLDPTTQDRLALLVDREGGRLLTTPRAVNRVLDAVRFWWPPLAGQLDLPDLVWLQLIRLSNADLYRWIEQYLTECSAVSLGRTVVSDGEKRQFFDQLKAIAEKEGDEIRSALLPLTDVLPGIWPVVVSEDGEVLIFHALS